MVVNCLTLHVRTWLVYVSVRLGSKKHIHVAV